MKRTILSIALVAALTAPAMAASNSWKKEAMDAWLDGKAERDLDVTIARNTDDVDSVIDNLMIETESE